MTPSPLTAARARQGTYSIVARDPASGELGVAVQSHWFSVGPIVPWARAGVGAVATQANVEVSYGPRALDLLEGGLGAQPALDRLIAEDGARRAGRWRCSTRRERWPSTRGRAACRTRGTPSGTASAARPTS